MILVLILVAWVGVHIYAHLYFKGYYFMYTKGQLTAYIQDCNALNEHILSLRDTSSYIHRIDYGAAQYHNVGARKRHTKYSNVSYAPNIYDCSLAVCDGARKQPFKYICKYFGVKENEQSLTQFEAVLNNFLAAADGVVLSQRKKNEVLAYVYNVTPWLIKHFFRKRLDKELGFSDYRFDTIYYPVYTFRYISAGGQVGTQFDVMMDIPMMERFITYLSERVRFKKSALGQRRLMTPRLRQFILARDNYTCRICGNSTYNEPNLLLEVDHIVPISRGGMTTEDNLQTLCWKCNRSKSANILY